MRLVLNGQPGEYAAVSIASLLASRRVPPERVVVARNGEVVPRERWSDPALAAGDVIEVVRIVAGGSG